jgi:hypothetical protein
VPVKTLRFGCVTLPLSVFRDNLEALCAHHDSEILPDLRDLLATLYPNGSAPNLLRKIP